MEALYSLANVPKSWPLARLTIPLSAASKHLERLLEGYCMEVLVTNSTMSWKGKCLDLEKAYRQVPVASASLAYSVALVHNVEGQPLYFVSQSLPFGACSSVYAFNRISHSLKFLVQKLLKGILTVFYDDFPILEPSASAGLFLDGPVGL